MTKEQFDKSKAEKRRHNIWKRTHRHLNRPVKYQSPEAGIVAVLPGSKIKYIIMKNGEWRRLK